MTETHKATLPTNQREMYKNMLENNLANIEIIICRMTWCWCQRNDKDFMRVELEVAVISQS